MKVQLETRNLELKKDAEGIAAKLNGQSFIVVRQASEVRPALRLGVGARYRHHRHRWRL